MVPTDASPKTATAGRSIQRPTPVTDRRTCANIHTAIASTTGGHTQLNRVIASYPGSITTSATPVAPIAAAGTNAQRCGRVVSRLVSAASSAHPTPRPASTAPVMTLSVAPAKTTSVRASALAPPTARDPATMRATGPVFAEAGKAVVSSRWLAGWMLRSR